MGKDSTFKITTIGIMRIKIFDGIIRFLEDVKRIQDLKRNLISFCNLNAKGYKYTNEGGVLRVSEGAIIVMKDSKRTMNLYVLHGTITIGDVDVASTSMSDDDVTKLWHMRLDHVSKNGMTKLRRRGHLYGQSISKLKFYEHYVFGKQRRVKFSKGIHKERNS